MPFELYAYRRVGDLERLLRALPPARGRTFLVAGSGDRELLAGVLSESDSPPQHQIRRWDEIYRYFCEALNVEKPRVQIDPPDHWLLLWSIVRRYRESGGVLPAGAQRRSFLTLLGSQIRELISEEVPPESLAAVCEEGDQLGLAFVSLYRAYLEALDRQGLSDSAGITTETHKLLTLPGAADVCRSLDLVLVGFSSLTHSQLALVRALVGRGAAVRLCAPVADLAGAYGAAQQFGVDGEALSERRPLRTVKIQGGDPRQELETAARSLTLWERGEGPLAELAPWPGLEAVAFSVPRARLAEAKEVFARYSLPVFWDFRRAISETPLWQLSSACLEAAGSAWQTEPTLRLLSLPWLCGFDLDIERLRAFHPRGAKGWEKALDGAGASARAAFADCRRYAAKVRRGGSALELLTALRTFASPRTLTVARLTVETPELDAQIALFSEALRELDRKILFIEEVVRDLGEFGSQKLSGAEARAYLTAWADGTTAAQGQRETGCLTVFAGAPPPLFHVPYWFMIGTEASQWPGGLRESPLLDEARKERLHSLGSLRLDRSHLPLLSEQRRQREFLFRRLIACGDRCTFICYSAVDAQERPQEESALTAAAAADRWITTGGSIVRGLDRLLAAPQEAALTPVEARQPDFHAENALPAGRVPPGRLEAAAAEVRLSSVDDFAECPYLFALRSVLGYEEPPREGEYDPLRGGAAVHALWERVWREYAASGCRGSVEEGTRRLFDEVVGENYPALLRSPSLSRALLELRSSAERCAAKQDEWETALRPLREKILCELDLPPLRRGAVTFSGRCDRLDCLKDGRFLLWDYKAGKSSAYGKAFQLGCYALALEGGGLGGKGCAGWGYVGQKDAAVSGCWDDDIASLLKKRSGSKSLREREEAAAQMLSEIARSMETKQFPPRYESKRCRVCAFAALCRRGEMSGDLEESGEGGADDE